MVFLGMDPREVALLAVRLRAQGAELSRVVSAIDGLVAQTQHAWPGADSEAFRQQWVSTFRPSFVQAAAETGERAAWLARQAGDQAEVSGMAGPGPRQGHLPGGGGERGRDWWVNPADPKLSIGGTHKFVELDGGEYSPAPGSREWWSAGAVEGTAEGSADADGLHAGLGLKGTVIGSGSENRFQYDDGNYVELGHSEHIGAEAKGSVSLGPEGASAEAQAMAGIRAGVEGGVGNDQIGVRGGADAIVGIGAEGRAHASIEDGKLRIGGKVGAAFVLGAKLEGEVEINVGAATKSAQDAFHSITSFFGGRR